jgi:hypothetical protein
MHCKLFHSLTFCGFAKKRIAKRNLSFKKAVCALKNVHFNTQCRFFCKGVVMGCGYFKPLLISSLRYYLSFFL